MSGPEASGEHSMSGPEASGEHSMSEFLLLGTRSARAGEVSLSRAAGDIVTLAAWHKCLRRWGLMRSFALPQDCAGELRACLIVRASGDQAASRLAAGWGRASGYQVRVLAMCEVRAS
jgi:hypothetical protein